jgi:hypothetical protein
MIFELFFQIVLENICICFGVINYWIGQSILLNIDGVNILKTGEQ